MSLLIKNGEIVTATERYKADIYCEDEQITTIGPNLDMEADEVIDATGQLIFPGFIDPHVHIYLPFMGTFSKDDYETASKAALIGGTTTLIEMCCPSREEEPLKAFQLWNSKAEGLSACDYTFHMGVTRFDDLAEAQLRTIVADYGITSFKVFLAYKGAFGIDDGRTLLHPHPRQRTGASSSPPIAKTPTSSPKPKPLSSPKEKSVPSGTNPPAPSPSKPKAAITS